MGEPFVILASSVRLISNDGLPFLAGKRIALKSTALEDKAQNRRRQKTQPVNPVSVSAAVPHPAAGIEELAGVCSAFVQVALCAHNCDR
jgi:hypothetical protein